MQYSEDYVDYKLRPFLPDIAPVYIYKHKWSRSCGCRVLFALPIKVHGS